ncbi:MAG: 3-isopropylmalate/(R)-2-methylmalate dehydratase small subunit, partial [Bradyrhizobium sp.]|nr:3-isopropylmalate/(R)-2-methylmalate dehydratase small subunit [Bradyrhizobium sp.]
MSIFCAYSIRKTSIHPRIKSEGMLLRNTDDLPFYAGGIRDKPPPENVFSSISSQEVRSMDKFTTLEGVAAPLKIINVDTDMVIPEQYLKTIKRTGLGKGLFAEQRYKDDGSENPDFILNKPAYRNAKILVAGDNFGCGSSREHAPWA